MEADEHRAQMRQRWEQGARSWASAADRFDETMLPVSRWLVDAIHPQPGHTVLELAAGTGEVGFLAYELVQPGGRLITTDGAQAMVDIALERARARGIAHIEARPMELEWIDLPAADVDGVLCRFGYMLVLDPEAALRETRRVLRPGGRVALAVWDVAERNPWLAATRDALVALGHMLPPPPGEPSAFALADPARLTELLEAAGFADVETEPVDVAFEAASLDDSWDMVVALGPSLRETLEALVPAEHARLRDAVDEIWGPYVAADGRARIPGRVLCAAAGA